MAIDTTPEAVRQEWLANLKRIASAQTAANIAAYKAQLEVANRGLMARPPAAQVWTADLDAAQQVYDQPTSPDVSPLWGKIFVFSTYEVPPTPIPPPPPKLDDPLGAEVPGTGGRVFRAVPGDEARLAGALYQDARGTFFKEYNPSIGPVYEKLP